MKKAYSLRAELWLYPGESANWHFISLPKKESEEIKKQIPQKRGFGSIPVTVTIGKSSWKTSLFPDKRSGTYLLPVKADIRRKEHLMKGESVSFVVALAS